MEDRQVYISFENEEYRLNKTELLKCRVGLVNLQKHLTRLSAIRSAKKRLIAQLLQQTSSAGFIVSRLDDKMPDKTMPKHVKDKVAHKPNKIKKEDHSKEKPKKILQKEESDFGSLDQELLELHSKIKSLAN
jgi:hypothetical protein